MDKPPPVYRDAVFVEMATALLQNVHQKIVAPREITLSTAVKLLLAFLRNSRFVLHPGQTCDLTTEKCLILMSTYY